MSALKAFLHRAGVILPPCGPLAGNPKIDDLTHFELGIDRIRDARAVRATTLSVGCLRRYCNTGSALVRVPMPYSSAVVVVSVDRSEELNVSYSRNYSPYYGTKSDLKLELEGTSSSRLIFISTAPRNSCEDLKDLLTIRYILTALLRQKI